MNSNIDKIEDLMNVSKHTLVLQNRDLEKENEALKKEVRRLENRCAVLERFYKEIVIKERGYFQPAMNVPIDEVGFSNRVLRRLQEKGLKVLGDIICCPVRQIYNIEGLGGKSLKEIHDVLAKHDLQIGMDLCEVFDDLPLEE